jgi:hypothetical protein
MGRERKSIQVGVMDIMRAITTSLTLASLLLVGLLSPSLAQPTAILGRKEDVMVWVLAFEISLALIIAFVVLRSQSASLVGRRKIRSDAATVTIDVIDAGGCAPLYHVLPAMNRWIFEILGRRRQIDQRRGDDFFDQRRFPSPWSVEEQPACFLVRDHSRQALAYVYYEEEPGCRSAAKLLTRNEARRIAVNIAKLPEILSRF